MKEKSDKKSSIVDYQNMNYRNMKKKRPLLSSATQQLKKPKWKKFNKMNKAEKKERIDYLWGRVRTYFRMINFVKGT